jgi:hypothetical protein
MPAFSNGWLEGFKKRNYIKSRVLHSEVVSLGVDAEEEMVENRKIISQYKEEDIFNMDEIGLFWNLLPSRGLLIEPQPSVKKEKARISINLCSNTTGSERIRPWFIGKAKTPRALRNVSVSAMGGEWRWNSKSWMNTAIMSQ